jgi:hypothetical protein
MLPGFICRGAPVLIISLSLHCYSATLPSNDSGGIFPVGTYKPIVVNEVDPGLRVAASRLLT